MYTDIVTCKDAHVSCAFMRSKQTHFIALQVGQLYVWGLLRWLTPSSSTFQSMESSSWLEWVYTQPMYIANTGGVSGALPITRPPSFASQDNERRR